MCLRTWEHFSSSVWAKKVAPSPCFVCHFSLFCFVNTHLARQLQQEHRWGAVIRKPRSAWLEGTPAMSLRHLNIVLKGMYLYVRIGLSNWDARSGRNFFSQHRCQNLPEVPTPPLSPSPSPGRDTISRCWAEIKITAPKFNYLAPNFKHLVPKMSQTRQYPGSVALKCDQRGCLSFGFFFLFFLQKNNCCCA